MKRGQTGTSRLTPGGATSGPRPPSAASRAEPLARDVVRAQLHRFKRGELYTSAGDRVTSRQQALAIALATAHPGRRDRGTGPAGAGQSEAEREAKLERALGALAEVNRELAAKVQPARAGQLALFADPAPAATDHAWQFQGQELHAPRAVIEVCPRCGTCRRTVRRNARALVTYGKAYDPQSFSRIRPPCAVHPRTTP